MSFEKNEPVVISNGSDKIYARFTEQDGGKLTFTTPGGSVITMGFFHAGRIVKSIKDDHTELCELIKFEHTGD